MNTNDIQKLANLARLSVDDDEASSLTKDMNTILDYIKQIENAHIDNDQVSDIAINIHNIMRDDIAVDCPDTTKDLIKQNFPHKKANYLEVNKIINND